MAAPQPPPPDQETDLVCLWLSPGLEAHSSLWGNQKDCYVVIWPYASREGGSMPFLWSIF